MMLRLYLKDRVLLLLNHTENLVEQMKSFKQWNITVYVLNRKEEALFPQTISTNLWSYQLNTSLV